MGLIECGACHRHVRHSEGACPFCGVAVVAAPRRPVATAGRIAALAMSAAVLTACGDDDGGVVPVYGAPDPSTTSTATTGGGGEGGAAAGGASAGGASAGGQGGQGGQGGG